MASRSDHSHRTCRNLSRRLRVERLELRSVLAAGALDLGFGFDGLAFAPIEDHDGGAAAVAIQADGKTVVAGTSVSWEDGLPSMTIVRYEIDGAIDTTFGVDGYTFISFGEDSGSMAKSIVVLPDGKLLVGGATGDESSFGFALARLNTDGTLDESFSDDGLVTTTNIGTAGAMANDLAVDSTGRIILAGGSSDDGMTFKMTVARYLDDGTLDEDFSEDGIATICFDSPFSFATAVAVDSSDRVIVGGSVIVDASLAAGVARLTADGELDTEFGTDGLFLSPEEAGNITLADLALDADERIVITGATIPFDVDVDDDDEEEEEESEESEAPDVLAPPVLAFVARLTADGEIDETFADGGARPLFAELPPPPPGAPAPGVPMRSPDPRRPEFPPGASAGFGVTIQPDGRIVITGAASDPEGTPHFALWRLLPDGESDRGFANRGNAVLPETAGVALDAAVLQNGQIIAVGIAFDDTCWCQVQGSLVGITPELDLLGGQMVTARFNTDFTRYGDAVYVAGTDRNDNLAIRFPTADTISITLNGFKQDYSLSEVRTIMIDAAAGKDFIAVTDSLRASNIVLFPGMGSIVSALPPPPAGAPPAPSGPPPLPGPMPPRPPASPPPGSYQIVLQSTEQMIVTGQSSDTASLFDGTANDNFVSTPATAIMSGPGYFNQVVYVGTVTGTAFIGGRDSSTMYDSPGNDTFTALSIGAYFRSPTHTANAIGFEDVTAIATAGGNDSAVLFDSFGNDTFTAMSYVSVLSSSNYIVRAAGFDNVRAISAFGGFDTAVMYDAYGDDSFVSMPQFATMWGQSYVNRADGFDRVYAFSQHGGDDSALIYGSSGNDTLYSMPEYMLMYGNGYYTQAQGFARTGAIGNGGIDGTYIYGSHYGDDLTAGGNALILHRGVGSQLQLFDFDVAYVSTPGPYGNVKRQAVLDFVMETYGAWTEA